MNNNLPFDSKRPDRLWISFHVALVALILAGLSGCQPVAPKQTPAGAQNPVAIDNNFTTLDEQTAKRLIETSRQHYNTLAAKTAADARPLDPNAGQPDPVLPVSIIPLSPDVPGNAAGQDVPAEPVFRLADESIADDLIAVDFNDMDIKTMLNTIGDITGINFIVDDTITGKVTVMSPRQIKVRELFDFLETILSVKGFSAVRSGEFVKIVPRDKVIAGNVNVRIGGDPAGIPLTDTVITQIIPLSYADTTEVMNIIKPLAKNAAIDIYPRTNSILVTDTSANINHLARIIQRLDVPGARDDIAVIPLRYAAAGSLAASVLEIVREGTSSPRANQPAVPGREKIKILPNPHINALVVVGSLNDIEQVRRIVNQLDVERPQGAINAHVRYLEHAPAEDVAKAITSAWASLQRTTADSNSQPVQIASDTGTNSLIITASVQDFEVIDTIIEKLDIVREQVLVELKILEISEDSLKNIGVDWQTLDNAVSEHIRGFGGTDFGIGDAYGAGTLEGLQLGAFKSINGKTKLGAILNALQKESGVNILSTPHIMTTNHKNAKIMVGENIPYVTNSRITETDPSDPTVIQTYDYKDVGLTLNITPHVNQGGIVRLEVESQFTKLVESVTGLGQETPTTTKRETSTTVQMKSGATVVIGGLIRDDKVVLIKKVPLLGDIPLLGELFKSRSERNQKTNLLIFVTPYILSSEDQLQEITQYKQNEFNRSSSGLMLKNPEKAK